MKYYIQLLSPRKMIEILHCKIKDILHNLTTQLFIVYRKMFHSNELLNFSGLILLHLLN